jgi:general stress protein YciG
VSASTPVRATLVDTDSEPKKLRGFALQKARGDDVSAIGRKGGVAAQAAGTAHRFTADEAREAGRKGGCAPHAGRKARPVGIGG